MSLKTPHRARKRFGQHFLVDRHYLERIAAAIDPRPGERIVEIGPGQGALTEALLARLDARGEPHSGLDVIEIDRDLVAHLRAVFPPERVRVHEADVLRVDFLRWAKVWQRAHHDSVWACPHPDPLPEGEGERLVPLARAEAGGVDPPAEREEGRRDPFPRAEAGGVDPLAEAGEERLDALSKARRLDRFPRAEAGGVAPPAEREEGRRDPFPRAEAGGGDPLAGAGEERLDALSKARRLDRFPRAEAGGVAPPAEREERRRDPFPRAEAGGVDPLPSGEGGPKGRVRGRPACAHRLPAGAGPQADAAIASPMLRVVGNLPYNISTPILFHLSRFEPLIRDMIFMLQKEVVDRIVAREGEPARGRLSVMLQYRFRVERLFEVPPGAFRPAPKVDSSVVRLEPLGPLRLRPRDEARFAEVVMLAFTQRRKMIRKALAAHLSPAQIKALGLDPEARAETLSCADFVALADALTPG